MSLSRVIENVAPTFSDYFDAIVEISRNLAIALKKQVTTVLSGILAITGAVIGAFIGGGRGVVFGTLAGSQLGRHVGESDEMIGLAEFLMTKLPQRLKSILVELFKTLLTPFKYIHQAVKAITESPELVSLFLKTMETFFSNNNLQYTLSTSTAHAIQY